MRTKSLKTFSRRLLLADHALCSGVARSNLDQAELRFLFSFCVFLFVDRAHAEQRQKDTTLLGRLLSMAVENLHPLNTFFIYPSIHLHIISSSFIFVLILSLIRCLTMQVQSASQGGAHRSMFSNQAKCHQPYLRCSRAKRRMESV